MRRRRVWARAPLRAGCHPDLGRVRFAQGQLVPPQVELHGSPKGLLAHRDLGRPESRPYPPAAASTGSVFIANLENNTGYGSGYRFGYYDSDLDFVELGRTSSSVTKLTMVKAQNIWVSGTSYSTSDNGGELIGCYHVQMPGSYNSYNAAYSEASDYSDGFVAWIDGAYQVRVGAYETKVEAESRASSLGGTVVGTSSYAVNVTQTGKAKILFQFDGGSSTALGIMPDVTGAGETRTWFKGYRYPGGFRYERVNGEISPW